MRRIVWTTSVLLAGLWTTLEAATPTTLHPLRERLSDEAVARDYAAMDALGARVAAFDTVTVPRLVYTHARAHAWLSLARDQYALNDASGLAEAAFEQAASMVTLLESRSSTLQAPGYGVRGSTRLREDLWQLSDSLKHTEALRCVADDLARLELALVRAGHEATRCRPSEPHPHAQSAVQQSARIRDRAAECVLPVAIEPAPVAPPLPEAAPSAVPAEVVAALKRLGALNNVHFDLNADTISTASAMVLDSVASVMRAVPEIRGMLIGHTDPRGSAAYNIALGRRRARAVFTHLVTAGVDTSRLSFASQGKGAPVALGSGIREYALNRRVEIQYSAPGGIQLDVRRQERDLQLERPRPAVTRKKPVVRKPVAAGKPVVRKPVAAGKPVVRKPVVAGKP